MRKQDKAKHMAKVNVLAEARFRESSTLNQGSINEDESQIKVLVESGEWLDNESRDFLESVKTIKPELYTKFVNIIKRKGLEIAKSEFHQYTKDGIRGIKKQERLSDEMSILKKVLDLVSESDMEEYMVKYRKDLLNGESVNGGVPSKRFNNELLSLLASAYIKKNDLSFNLLNTPPIRKNPDSLDVFDEVNDLIYNQRINKLFEKVFGDKFDSIINRYL